MNNIAIITARSGSKGLKDKNIKSLCGKPLIEYTIQAAICSECFDKVMVSTDSSLYAEMSKQCGAEVPFLRSEEKSGDSSSSWDVVREVLEEYGKQGEYFTKAALLQPTSPLRDADDIRGAFSLFQREEVHCVVSVTEVEHPIQWCFRMEQGGYIRDLAGSPYNSMRRQELEKYYRENGAIYIVSAEKIMDLNYDMYADGCYGYEMPAVKSVDIDTENDFNYAQFLMQTMKKENI